MVDLALILFGAALPLIWGIAHLFPTRNVVAGFGEISIDNQRIVRMEWITEGVTALIFIALVVIGVTIVDHSSPVARTVYCLSFVVLNVLSVVSLFTGAKISFLPFKLCPVVFTGSSILILLGLAL